jgi:hypothetical protein
LHQELRDAFVSAVLKVAPMPLARFNNARLRFPRRVYFGPGAGIGDDLLCTTVFRELKKRGEARIVVRSKHRSLFRGNPDVDIVLRAKLPWIAPLMVHGLSFLQLAYDVPLSEHLLAIMCRCAGVTGEIALRPYMFLRPDEVAVGRLFERQIAIQSSGLSAAIPMRNKEWFPERFQDVAHRLQGRAPLIQLGAASDPPLKGALDLRGKTSLRQAAAILSHSLVFVGQVGFLMHLARAVDCRSVIVYGGREAPRMTGYIANKNLVGATPCSPCWEQDKCDHDRECMRMISVEAVTTAALDQIQNHGQPLETEVVRI